MIAAVWIPDLPLQAIERAADEVRLGSRPRLVVERADWSGGTQVLCVSASAAEAGLRAGMTVAQCRALVGDLTILARQPALEQAAAEALRDAGAGFSPRLDLRQAASGWLYLDVVGLERRVGTAEQVARALLAAARVVGLDGHVGIARTKTLARLLALGGSESAVALAPERAAERAFVSDLPLAALEPSPELAATLQRWGMRRVGELLTLRPADLAERLGPEALALARRAAGEDTDGGIYVAPPDESFSERSLFDWGIADLEALGFVLRGLLDRLTARLELRGYLAGDLRLDLDFEGMGGCQREVPVSAPTRDVRALLALCRLRLESQPPEHAICGVAVHVQPRGSRARQLSFFEPVGPAPDRLAVTVARLEAMCGSGRVGAPRPLDAWRDDAHRVEPFDGDPPRPTAKPPASAPPAALRRFRPPREVKVQCWGGEPMRLEGERLGGRIVAWSGPFRREAEWWQERSEAGDTYDIQLGDGAYYRLRLDADAGTWWVLGRYD
jgi:protein ImuB